MPPPPPFSTFGTDSPTMFGSDEEHLAQILLGTLAIDSEKRKSAEHHLTVLLFDHCPAFVRALVTLTVEAYPPCAAVRAQATLVLRLHLPSFWPDVELDTREWLKFRFLTLLSENSASEIRHPLLFTLTTLAFCVCKDGDGSFTSCDLDENGRLIQDTFMFEEAWPDFSATLFANLVSDSSLERRNALEVVTMLADSNDRDLSEVAPTFFKYAPTIMTALKTGLADCSTEIRMAAASCAVYLLDAVDPRSHLPVDSLSPRLLKMLESFIEDGQFHLARAFVEMVVDQHTWYWAGNLPNFGRVLLQLTELPEVREDEDRHRLYLCAVEAMLCIFEEQSRPTFESCMFLCPTLFTIFTEGLMDPDDTDAFAEAKCSLHRLATALGGIDITNLVRDCHRHFFTSRAWQRRHAGVCAIAEIHEASVGAFEHDLQLILNIVQHMHRTDENARVRSAAAQTMQILTSPAGG